MFISLAGIVLVIIIKEILLQMMLCFYSIVDYFCVLIFRNFGYGEKKFD